MARPRGVEPLTFWAVTRHSVQLSYGRIGGTNRTRTGNHGVAVHCLSHLAMVPIYVCYKHNNYIIHIVYNSHMLYIDNIYLISFLFSFTLIFVMAFAFVLGQRVKIKYGIGSSNHYLQFALGFVFLFIIFFIVSLPLLILEIELKYIYFILLTSFFLYFIYIILTTKNLSIISFFKKKYIYVFFISLLFLVFVPQLIKSSFLKDTNTSYEQIIDLNFTSNKFIFINHNNNLQIQDNVNWFRFSQTWYLFNSWIKYITNCPTPWISSIFSNFIIKTIALSTISSFFFYFNMGKKPTFIILLSTIVVLLIKWLALWFVPSIVGDNGKIWIFILSIVLLMNFLKTKDIINIWGISMCIIAGLTLSYKTVFIWMIFIFSILIFLLLFNNKRLFLIILILVTPILSMWILTKLYDWGTDAYSIIFIIPIFYICYFLFSKSQKILNYKIGLFLLKWKWILLFFTIGFLFLMSLIFTALNLTNIWNNLSIFNMNNNTNDYNWLYFILYIFTFIFTIYFSIIFLRDKSNIFYRPFHMILIISSITYLLFFNPLMGAFLYNEKIISIKLYSELSTNTTIISLLISIGFILRINIRKSVFNNLSNFLPPSLIPSILF